MNLSFVPEGFLSDEKWYEDLGHIVQGLIPFWGHYREYHKQWPPDRDQEPAIGVTFSDEPFNLRGTFGDYGTGEENYVAESRILGDFRRDQFGYEVGRCILVMLCIGLGITVGVMR